MPIFGHFPQNLVGNVRKVKKFVQDVFFGVDAQIMRRMQKFSYSLERKTAKTRRKWCSEKVQIPDYKPIFNERIDFPILLRHQQTYILVVCSWLPFLKVLDRGCIYALPQFYGALKCPVLIGLRWLISSKINSEWHCS